MNRIYDEISNLEKFKKELSSIIPNSYNDYEESFLKRAACERYFEKIVETIISISYLICKRERWKLNDKYQSLNILEENHIISRTLLIKLKDAKGMRNIITHQYGEINDLIVFESITKELLNDVDCFIKAIDEI